jgi:MFS transporter, DHA2 family, multidrug resistance protein
MELVSLIIRELRTSTPVVDLRALRNRSFSAGVFLISLLGFVLYASLVLLPIYLQMLLGYPAYNAGLALSPRGIGSLATTPLAGYLTGKTDPRRLLGFGLVLGSLTMFALSRLNLNTGYWNILWPQVLQGIALSFLFVPLMTLSMAEIPKEKLGNATSIFNLMRNIGGSAGIAIMTTFFARRSQMHQHRLIENITAGSLKTRETLQTLETWFHTNGVDSHTASRRAWTAFYGMVQRHASMLSFVEVFWVLGVMFLVMLPFILLLRDPRPKLGEQAPPAAELTVKELRDGELLLVP